MLSILPPLIAGTQPYDFLTKEDRLLLTRWAAKTAYCLDSALPATPMVPPIHGKKLWRDTDRLPQGTVVLLVKSPFSVPIDFVISRNWYHRTGAANQDSTESQLVRKQDRSYKVTFQFGYAVILVVFWPDAWDDFWVPPGIFETLWTDRTVIPCLSLTEQQLEFHNHSDFLMSISHLISTAPPSLRRAINVRPTKDITLIHHHPARIKGT